MTSSPLSAASIPSAVPLTDPGPPLHETYTPLSQTLAGRQYRLLIKGVPSFHLFQAVDPHSVGSLDSGHATMSSTAPATPHSHVTSGRGPMKATVRPRGLPQSSPQRPPNSIFPGPSSHSHRRSRSVDSIRPNHHTSSKESSLSTRNISTGSPSTSHSSSHRSQHSAMKTNTATRAISPLTSTRANQRGSGSQGRPVAGQSNKENTPNSSVDRGGGQWGSENLVPLKSRGSGVPFRDRTNISSQSVSQVGQQERRKVVGKGNSLSELAPPLNAARLRPIRQSTRTATVSPTIRHSYCIPDGYL